MQSSWLLKRKVVEPYSQLAYIYDYVMRHVNYPRWASYLSKLFTKADVPVHDVVDIACGTGSLMLKLHELDYQVAGLDESEAMLKMARTKMQEKSLRVPLWCGSMKQFHVARPFQAAVCTYDSINYCMDEDGVLSTLQRTSEVLCQGGVFVFDLCTLRNSKRNFRRYHENEGRADFQYIRRSHFLAHKRIQVNKFLIQWNSQKNVCYEERHVQRIFKINEIMKLIPHACFEVVGVYDGFSLRKGSESSDRVHFVLKRI
ncbi:class I SAM-dependent methyltransferase [candidate division KSB1 bacterium]|nr:class I SAM-dependent methyltransferase [candidate division KSB1 bacterium]NIR71342.1 class I SAM-dependent methyltransferase [candidate division KSB1 bacterium]NIS26232.1 class I SAM-dependent methyltransferase [candidate division KSB1 bacterium]NIT74662.1 class I SAM-dependent methyltransferase [candidate division KSB1 bacterium]NIU26880.1 class I SAM-dependent methyltransferase [candidate division KSB1 bacterium]